MCVFKYHAFIFLERPPPWYGTIIVQGFAVWTTLWPDLLSPEFWKVGLTPILGHFGVVRRRTILLKHIVTLIGHSIDPGLDNILHNLQILLRLDLKPLLIKMGSMTLPSLPELGIIGNNSTNRQQINQSTLSIVGERLALEMALSVCRLKTKSDDRQIELSVRTIKRYCQMIVWKKNVLTMLSIHQFKRKILPMISKSVEV